MGALHFGRNRDRLLHPRFELLLALGGTPLVAPTGRRGFRLRVWKLVTNAFVAAWLFCILISHFSDDGVGVLLPDVYFFAHGRFATEYILCLALYSSWRLRKIVASKTLESVLRQVVGGEMHTPPRD